MPYVPPVPITDREKYWEFSTIKPPVPDSDLVQIKAFSVEGAQALWTKAVSAVNGHLMTMKDDNPFSPSSPERVLSYRKHWYHDEFDETREFLQTHLSWHPSTAIYTFWSSLHAMATTWDVFLKWWPCWVFEDEGLIVLSEASSEVAIFCCGTLSIQTRSTPPLFVPKE